MLAISRLNLELVLLVPFVELRMGSTKLTIQLVDLGSFRHEFGLYIAI